MTTEFKSAAPLKEEIKNLTARKILLQKELHIGLNDVMQSLKPANLLRSAAGKLSKKPTLLKVLTAIAVTAGASFLAKKMLPKKSTGRTFSALKFIGLASLIAIKILPEKYKSTGISTGK